VQNRRNSAIMLSNVVLRSTTPSALVTKHLFTNSTGGWPNSMSAERRTPIRRRPALGELAE
jgi:hypothetical protein